MGVAIALGDFLQLVYGNLGRQDDGLRLRVRNVLGKDVVETMSDVRAVTMALDRQTYPTPMIVRFSEGDVKFAQVNGIDCPIDRHDISVSGPSVFTGVYEPHLVACFTRICRPASVVFDVGANLGYHSLLLSRLAGSNGHVYAFEPNSENCRLILLALEHDQISNITLLPIALSDRRGWAYFSSFIGSNGGFVTDRLFALQQHGTVVPTFRLDELSLPDVDVIKVDVEGAEYKALKGADSMLRRCRPAVVCEFSMEMARRISEVDPAYFLGWVESMEYKVFVLDRNSCQACAIDSVAALCDGWGSLARIEDLLFMPREKVPIVLSG